LLYHMAYDNSSFVGHVVKQTWVIVGCVVKQTWVIVGHVVKQTWIIELKFALPHDLQ
jgi:hypothetical protein